MSQGDVSALLVIGGAFILLGLAAIIWDWVEKKGYLGSISHHLDTREFLDGWPPRPQFGALKTGGWIAIILGLVLLVLGMVFWRQG
jgi:multisubunit Na+/H+ antiporter MnhB subunit